MSTAQIADTGLQEGQGMHGALSRDNTFNSMAAVGPDFKKRFVDDRPVGNADVPRTLALILGFSFADKGKSPGRVIAEALATDKSQPHYGTHQRVLVSKPAGNGKRTVLLYQRYKGQFYLDSARLADAEKDRSKGEQNAR